MNKILQIINEEIEQFDWGKEKVADEPIKPNRIVYHISEPKFRESIAQNGLQPKVGDSYSQWTGGQGAKNPIPAIFATNSDLNSVTGGIQNFGGDVWGIDTTKINNQWYEDKHFAKFKDWGINNTNIVTFENIPKEALFLAQKAVINMNEDYNHADYLRWKRQNVTLRGMQELGKENNGMASFGQGLYTAALGNKELARKYGKVYFVVGAIPKHPKVVNTWNEAEMFIQKVVMMYGKERGIDDYFDAKRDFDTKTNVRDEMLKLGYDGLMIRGREMVNYTPPDNVMYFNNENELKNYYEYAIV